MNQPVHDSVATHETKFILNNITAKEIIQWLQSRNKPDPEFPAGIISSIYYDTWDWHFLRAKVNSDYLKTKVRIRWYADIDSEEPEDKSFLEVKYKVGSRRKKIRIKTDYSGSWLSSVSLDDQSLLKIPHLLRSHGVVINEHLYPAFQITYKRLRFIEPITGVRLCLDYDIGAPRVNRQMLPRTHPFWLQNAVFELKGKINELPDVLYQLTALGCWKQSFSKYSACYQKIMQVAF